MYKTILVTLEATATDRAIIEHVKQLASGDAQPRRAAARGNRCAGTGLRTGRGRPRN